MEEFSGILVVTLLGLMIIGVVAIRIERAYKSYLRRRSDSSTSNSNLSSSDQKEETIEWKQSEGKHIIIPKAILLPIISAFVLSVIAVFVIGNFGTLDGKFYATGKTNAQTRVNSATYTTPLGGVVHISPEGMSVADLYMLRDLSSYGDRFPMYLQSIVVDFEYVIYFWIGMVVVFLGFKYIKIQ